MSQSSQTIARRYRPATDVTSARLLPGKPAFIDRKQARGRYAVGVRYERKAIKRLAQLALEKTNLTLLEGPWFEFVSGGERRWCQLDALLLDTSARAAIIYEIKYQHTVDAWWQLVHLYSPVIRVAYPRYRPVCLCEVVHWYDPSKIFPQPHDLTDSPLRIPHANRVAVCIFNPKRGDGVSTDGHYDSQGAREAPGAVGLPQGAK